MELAPRKRERRLKRIARAEELPYNRLLSRSWFRGLRPIGPNEVTITIVCEHFITINPMVAAKPMTTLSPASMFASYDIQATTYCMWQDGVTPAAGCGMSQRYWATAGAAAPTVTAGPDMGLGGAGGWVGKARDLFGGIYPASAQKIWDQCSHQYLQCQPKSCTITYTPLNKAPRIKRIKPTVTLAMANGTTPPATTAVTMYQTHMQTDSHKPAGRMIAVRDQFREIISTIQGITLPPPATSNWNQLERTGVTSNSFIDIIDYASYMNIVQQKKCEHQMAGSGSLVVAWPILREMVLKPVAAETGSTGTDTTHFFDEPMRWWGVHSEPGLEEIPSRELNIATYIPGPNYGMIEPGTTWVQNSQQAQAPEDILMYRRMGAGLTTEKCDWWYKRFGVSTFMLEIPPYQAADRADTGVAIVNPTAMSSDQQPVYKYRVTKEFTMKFIEKVDYHDVDALEEAVIWPPLVAPQHP